MLGAILSIVGSLFSALPKLLDAAREWRVAKGIKDDRANKDERNRKAIEDARRAAGGK